MSNRNNKFFEMVVKKGVEMSRKKRFAAARKMLEKAGLPMPVIERVLYEPHNIRSTDPAF
jgi:hypothetical protein